MSKHLFFIVVLLGVSAVAADWALRKTIELEQNEFERITIKEKATRYHQNLEFRWVLYTNKVMNIILSLDQHISQYTVSKRYNNDSIKLTLLQVKAMHYQPPYMFIKFKDFNVTGQRATFEIMLSDQDDELALEFLNETADTPVAQAQRQQQENQ